jgi:2,4-dienoyl-CoA reductase-like NADH-dependent reductase (Old Yellow Enzyme family)
MSASLFSEIDVEGLVPPIRIAVEPMCQCSTADGSAIDWHLQHWMMLAVAPAW